METFLSLLSIVGVGYVIWLQYRFEQRWLSKQAGKQDFSSLPEPSKNSIPDGDDGSFEFDEHSPMELPKDVKFDVEGGDVVTPN